MWVAGNGSGRQGSLKVTKSRRRGVPAAASPFWSRAGPGSPGTQKHHETQNGYKEKKGPNLKTHWLLSECGRVNFNQQFLLLLMFSFRVKTLEFHTQALPEGSCVPFLASEFSGTTQGAAPRSIFRPLVSKGWAICSGMTDSSDVPVHCAIPQENWILKLQGVLLLNPETPSGVKSSLT